MKNKLFKMISLFMAVVMVTTIIPIGTYANETEKDTSESFSAIDEKEIEIEYEIESKRTENSKTYVTSDGSFYQISTVTPIHKEINGIYEEIADVDSEINNAEEAIELVSRQVRSITESKNNIEKSSSGSLRSGVNNTDTFELYCYSDDEGEILTDEWSIKGSRKGNTSLLIKSNILSDKTVFVNSAHLMLTAVDTDDNQAFEVYRITEDWDNNLSYFPDYNENLLYESVETGDYNEAQNGTREITLNLNTYFHYCALGLYNNYGLIAIPSYRNTEIEFAEDAVLAIQYRELSDVDNQIDSEQIDLGRAGNVYINHYTASPTLVRDDISNFSEIGSTTVQTILNPLDIDSNDSDGSQTRTNFYSTLQYYLSGEYLWKSCSGENIYFVADEDNSTNSIKAFKGIDSSGAEYSLNLSKLNGEFDYTAYHKTLITDNQGNTYNFGIHTSTGSDLGYLVKITDNSNSHNIIRISYTNDNGNIEDNIGKITDSTGRFFKYNYTNGMLSSINIKYSYEDDESGETVTANSKINNTDITISFEYSNGMLSKVIYSDGYTVLYEYSNGRIASVTNYKSSTLNDDNKTRNISFTYANSSTNYLAGYTLKNGNTVIESKTISSAEDSIFSRVFTDITDQNNPTNKKVVYDSDEKLVYYSDYEGKEYYLNYTNSELTEVILESDDTSYIQNSGFANSDSWTLSSMMSVNNGTLKANPRGNECYAYQTISSNFYEGETYILSAESYLAESSLPKNDIRNYCIVVYYTDSQANKITLAKMNFDTTWFFDDDDLDKQFRKMIFTIPEDINSLTVKIEFNNMEGISYFDNVDINQVTSSNAIDVSSGALTNEFTPTYNSDGTIASETKTSTLGKQIGTYYEYNGSTLSEVIDNGISTYYEYDETNGLLMSKGKNSDTTKNTQYSYNGIGALTQVSQAIEQADSSIINNTVAYTYDDDKIVSITHNGFAYHYDYYPNGSLKEIYTYDDVDEEKDFSIQYGYIRDKIGTITYGNGDTLNYTYDGKNITSITYNNANTPSYEFEYDDNNNLVEYTDNINNTITTYSDTGYTVTRGNTVIYSKNSNSETLFGNNISVSSNQSHSNTTGITTATKTYTINANDYTIYSLIDSLDRHVGSSYRSNTFTVNNAITFEDYSNSVTTSRVSSYTSSIKIGTSNFPSIHTNLRLLRITSYEYDANGRISNIYRKSVNNIAGNKENTASTENGATTELVHHYDYDNAGQVVTEIDLENEKAIKYAYNAGGNLTSKSIWQNDSGNNVTEFTYNASTNTLTVVDNLKEEITYSYKTNGNKDYLAQYNNINISYDAAGNPLNYAGKSFNSDVTGALSWNGNKLHRFYVDNNDYYEYKYNSDGYRTEKAYYDNGVLERKIEYVWDNDIITAYKISAINNNNTEYRVIKPIFDNEEKMIGISIVEDTFTDYDDETFTATDFAFVKDGQGNVVDMYSADESAVIHYSYDAFGNPQFVLCGELSDAIENTHGNTPIGTLLLQMLVAIVVAAYIGSEMVGAPQGYRGYIYDYETGLLATQTRYYSSSWGRFINADDPMMLTENMDNVYSANLFAYCNNDPVNSVDYSGYDSTSYNARKNILSNLDIIRNNLTNISIASAYMNGTIHRELDILGLRLKTNTDSNVEKYWNTVLGNDSNTVGNNYSIDYFNSNISVSTSSNTKYSVKNNNSLYKTNPIIR